MFKIIENKQPINYLELLAAFYALRAFCKDDERMHVGLKMDNTCAIAYINNMGGIVLAIVYSILRQTNQNLEHPIFL
jgi:hypothetical protein